MDTSPSILDPLFALAVLGFILGIGVTGIRHFARTSGAGANNGSLVLGPNIRGWYYSNLEPVEELCIRWGIRPSHLSYTQAATSLIVALCYADGMLFTGGWLLLFSGSLDIVDGRVARRTNSSSAQGAFIDSVIDRYADAFAFLGLAVLFRDSWVLWATLLALIGGLMVSYTRARAEGLGAECKVGLLQRPERCVILGFGTMFGAIFDHITRGWIPSQPHYLVAVVIVGLAILVNVTALQRIVYVFRLLSEKANA